MPLAKISRFLAPKGVLEPLLGENFKASLPHLCSPPRRMPGRMSRDSVPPHLPDAEPSFFCGRPFGGPASMPPVGLPSMTEPPSSIDRQTAQTRGCGCLTEIRRRLRQGATLLSPAARDDQQAPACGGRQVQAAGFLYAGSPSLTPAVAAHGRAEGPYGY